MLELVVRQQELRLRVMVALYEGLVRDPQTFWDVMTLDLRVAPALERAVSDDEAPRETVPDFTDKPPSPSEARAAAFYLLERGLCVHLPSETSDAARLMLRISAVGIDALEGMVLSGHARAAERPIGFNALESVAVGMPQLAAVQR
jgi:hypothetical protein